MKNNILIVTFIVVIFCLIGYILFNKPSNIVKKFDDSALRIEIQKQDSITRYWQQKSKYWENLANSYELKLDSLESLKPAIHEKYNKQIHFNKSATVVQLDSFIRANWE